MMPIATPSTMERIMLAVVSFKGGGEIIPKLFGYGAPADQRKSEVALDEVLEKYCVLEVEVL